MALIVATLKKPKYLIIDEISNGLDIETLEILKDYLKDLAYHSLVLATGHHFEFYNQIIDDLLVIHDNKIKHIKDYNEEGGDLYEIYRKYNSHS